MDRLDAEAILRTMRQPLVVLDGGLRVVTANPAFYRTYGIDPTRAEGRPILELGDGQWNIAELRKLLEDILPNNGSIEGFRIEHEFARIGRRVMILNALRMERAQDPNTILVAIDDITEQEHLRWLLEGEKEFADPA